MRRGKILTYYHYEIKNGDKYFFMYFNQLLLHKRSEAPLVGEKLGQFCGPVTDRGPEKILEH